jgi:ADP-dependent NAD(P)H-hydrate dehydratase
MSVTPPLRLPRRPLDAHKGDFGRTLLIGASRGMSGSIAMSSVAALRSGAGLVTAAVPDRCLETVASFHPSIMTLAVDDGGKGIFSIQAVTELAHHFHRASSIGCGPGMTTGAGSIRLVERLIEMRSIPRVFDADALNCLAILGEPDRDLGGWPSRRGADWGPVVLTPHPGELMRLTGVSPSDSTAQLEAAQALSNATGAVIVVKGGPTRVVRADEVWINETGNPGMATAGSGDVLTGVVAALLGQQLSPWDAARLGVWVHGLAGDLAASRWGQTGMTSREILDFLPQAMMMISTADSSDSPPSARC